MSKPEPDASASPPEVVVTVVVPLAGDTAVARHRLRSARDNADLPLEVTAVVEDGDAATRELADELADRTVTTPGPVGLARSWNLALDGARGRFAAFCTADVVLPAGWDRLLVESAESHPAAAVVVPTIVPPGSASPAGGDGGSAPARPPAKAGEAMAPFSPVPVPGVHLLAVTRTVELGGWDEGYLDATDAVADLCFTAWVNDLDVVVDGRVLVERTLDHDSTQPAPAPSTGRPPSVSSRRFRDRWRGGGEVVRLPSCPPARFDRNRATAGAVVDWMARDDEVRTEETARMRRQLRAMGSVNRQLQAQVEKPANRLERTARGVVGPSAKRAVNRLSPSTVRRVRRLMGHLPPSTEAGMRRLARRLGISRGPGSPRS